MHDKLSTIQIRPLQQNDFLWLKDFDASPLHLERDSIYLFFCVHFSSTAFVAVNPADNKPVGFVLGFVPSNRETAYVHYLFVQDIYRRRGIGRSLMEAFIASARGVGAEEVVLFTIRAVDFYQKLGFTVENRLFSPELANYIEQVKGAKIMSIDL